MAPRTGFASAFVAVAFSVAGCAGGGATGNSVVPLAAPTAPASFVPAATPIIPFSYNADYDTGSVGPVGTAGAALWGSAPPQIASPGGPALRFEPAIPPPDTIFPVLAAGLQFTPGAVSPLALGNDAAARVTELLADPCGDSLALQLVIPSANINTTVYDGLGTASNPHADYSLLGTWTAAPGKSLAQSGPFVEYLFGYETPASALPASGQGSFAGHASGLVFAPIDGHVMKASLSGAANFSVDFGSGRVTGAFTGMQYDGGAIGGSRVGGAWNDVSISAAIATGSSRFSGSAAAASAPQTPFSLTGSASGHIDGALFGPLQTLQAVWSLGDGTAAAIGGVAALPAH